MGLFEGAIAGFGIKCFANMLRKEPMMKAPWEHVISVGVFAFLGKTYSDQYQKMRLSLYDELGMFNRHAEGIKWQMAEKEQ